MIRECLRPDGVMLPSLFLYKDPKAKTRLVGGFFRIVVPGLGIEPRTRGFSIPDLNTHRTFVTCKTHTGDVYVCNFSNFYQRR
ncbi:hypothetical protein D4N08_05935 [Escherichia coli]|nr:hypothetical protein D4N08_05935 [Escherichia coli]